jgi:cbb3-type cytochrome oxidase cytochrome c subunit
VSPESTSPGSIMPGYKWLFDQTIRYIRHRKKMSMKPLSTLQMEITNAKKKQMKSQSNN